MWDIVGWRGATASVLQACTGGHVDLVALLLEHGASIAHATPSGRTAVIMASLPLGDERERHLTASCRKESKATVVSFQVWAHRSRWTAIVQGCRPKAEQVHGPARGLRKRPGSGVARNRRRCEAVLGVSSLSLEAGVVELLLRGTELAESEETSEALISACANGHPGRSRFRSGVLRA